MDVRKVDTVDDDITVFFEGSGQTKGVDDGEALGSFEGRGFPSNRRRNTQFQLMKRNFAFENMPLILCAL